jgi:hypothetical protein
MLTHLTVPRLATLQSFFKTSSDKDTLGCYAWNQAVGASMLPILGDFEISFRNALHRALSRHFGGVDSFNWMMERPNPAHSINPAAPKFLPAVHKLSKRSKDDIKAIVKKIKDRKPYGYVVTPDDIVASVPFGFWEVLISGLSHNSQPIGLSAIILAATFPHAPNTAAVPYGDPNFTTRVNDLLKRIRDVRNRIGHHDSLWTMPEFDVQGGIGFIPRKPRHTIISLRLFADRICWFSSWIDPGIQTYIQNSDHWYSIQALLHRQALVISRQLGGKVGTYREILDSTKLHPRNKKSLRKPCGKLRMRLLANRYHY